MSSLPLLLPMPREIRRADGVYPLTDHRLIGLDSVEPQALLLGARRLHVALRTHIGLTWEITASISRRMPGWPTGCDMLAGGACGRWRAPISALPPASGWGRMLTA